MLLSAKNARIILLTGTPMINYPNELGILFNILRGYIKTWEFSLEVKSGQIINQESLQRILSASNTMDYINYENKKLFITRNPFGFENTADSHNNYSGVTKEHREIDDDQFESNIIRLLQQNGIELRKDQIIIHPYKCLPDNLSEFLLWFINETKTIKNPEIFKRRIMGLTSYFRSAQEELLPRYEKRDNFKVITIPMSDPQFVIYEKFRREERKQEKSAKTQKPGAGELYKEPSSTYRIWSRLFCNFVSPTDIPRPMPRLDKSENEQIIDIEQEEDSESDEEEEGKTEIIKKTRKSKKPENLDDLNFEEPEYNVEETALEKEADSTYINRIKTFMQQIQTNASRILSKSGLAQYSPKFLEMLENITDEDNEGLHLVYSQFRTIEGIGIFQMVLNYHGFTQFKIKQNSQGQWDINISEENQGKPTYALYTGTESREEKEAVRNIYNGDWDETQDLSPSLVDYLKRTSSNNNLGEIIKIFMITSSGSEGINLRNTRFVHIMEPYWHPVRTEQVIGRARRICSHKNLPKQLQTVDVFLYLMSFSKSQLLGDTSIELKRKDLSKLEYPDPYAELGAKPVVTKRPFSSDQTLYEISTIKENISNQLLKNIKEASIDCATYSDSNSKEGLQCLQFGEADSKSISFNPDIKKDNNVVSSMTNKELVTWKAQKLKLDRTNEDGSITKIEYAYRETGSNFGNIYDLDSYYAAQRNPGTEPILIGTYDRKIKKIEYIK
jgi:hypothetical protein